MDQVNLVDHRNDLEVFINGGIGVGHRLRLNSLEGIDQQHRPFTAGQAAGDLVVKVDVARRVDQVELVPFALVLVLHPDSPSLDGDAPLPLQFHVVEHLRLQLPFIDCLGVLQQPVGQGALAVVDVGNDREVADVLAVEGHERLSDRR